ncbi:MAG: hypothetical protein CME61_04415 [Halobacteriovoraceae bacterium]|nr:hypothetical protein [Halobacteriovoraceae bacterium]
MKKVYPNKKIIGKKIYLHAMDLKFAKCMFDSVVEDRSRLSKYLTWPPRIKTLKDEENFIKNQNIEWNEFRLFGFNIFRNDDNLYLGNVNAFSINWSSRHFEIGYWVLGKYEGHGYVTQAVKLLINELRRIGFNRIVIRCDKRNKRSSKIPKLLGFQLEGIQREVKRIDDKYYDLEVYSHVPGDKDIH